MAEKKQLTYKGRPLLRKDDFIYYGSMSDEYIIMLQITEKKKLDDIEMPSRVSVQLQFTSPDVSYKERVIKQAEKSSIYDAIDLGSIWLEKVLKS
ncbi:MAG: hypothetical protein LBO63_04920 [Oscillospiraceae bacterium]|jgi:hypothetical protein|nr:hypothetical protein [Oscillospiraceae bacterium]